TLQALVLVRDAKNAADRTQGAQLCFGLLERGGSSREKDLCIALADVADAQGEYLGRAVGTLRSVNDRLTDKDRVGVEQRYGALAVKHFDLLEDQAYRQLGNAAEFAKLIKEAEGYAKEVAEAELRLTTLRTLAGAKSAPGPDTAGELEKLLANKKA